MKLLLKRIQVKGNKSYIEVDSQGFVAPSKALLYPVAAESFSKFLKFIHEERDLHPLANDIFRTTHQQVQTLKKKPNLAYKPGTSGHEFGISVDISTGNLFAEAKNKKISYSVDDLRNDFLKFGWTYSLKEVWHFNHLDGRLSIQSWVQEMYGDIWSSDNDLSSFDLQRYLTKLGYYTGRIDGIIGLMTKDSIKSFQKDYLLDVDGIVGPNTRKLILVASAELDILS